MRYTLTLLALSLAGCGVIPNDDMQTRMRNITGGVIGCPGREVTISEPAPFSWRADCRGRTFYCQGSDGFKCTEAIRPAK